MRQRGQIGHCRAVWRMQTGRFDRGLDFLARWRIIIQPYRITIALALEQFAHPRAGGQLTRCHDHLGIARLPIVQRSLYDFGDCISGIFQKHHPGARKKPLRFDGILKQGGLFSQCGCRNPRQAHFFFSCRTNQRADDFLPAQGDPHCITAIDQYPGFIRIRPGKISYCVAAG